MTAKTQAVQDPVLYPEAELSGARSAGWWAMLILILNEAVIFAALVASYFYLRINSPIWPQAGIDRPGLVLPILLTIILISSSCFMQWAEVSIKRGNIARMRLALLIAFLLAGLFLALQIYEYARSEFTPQTVAYASLFFGITGVHGVHVFIAALMNLFLQVRARMGHFTQRRHLAVENTVLYWHFVDLVWLVILSSLYLSPYL
jgi:heme/copper-type cytochrome/quinol oxidase subunit 3